MALWLLNSSKVDSDSLALVATESDVALIHPFLVFWLPAHLHPPQVATTSDLPTRPAFFWITAIAFR
jgi:hypothetical protein